MIKINAKDESFRQEVQNGAIWPVVLHVCVPLAIYSWIRQLFDVLDTLMASRISAEAVSTVVYMVQLQHIVLAVGNGLAVGCGILIAHAYGRGDGERIKTIVSTTMALCGFLSLLIILVIPFTPAILRLAGTPEIFISLGSNYFAITLVGIIVQFFTTIYISCERCRGRSRKILALNMSVVLIKLAVTALFVFVLNGDIVSIAWATLLSYLVLLAFSVRAFLVREDAFSFSVRYVRFGKNTIGDILRLSFPSMVEKMAFSAGKAMVNRMAANYGTEVVGAAGISNNMSGLLTGIDVGVEDGGSSIEGQLYGTGNIERTVRVYRHLLAAVAVIGCTGFVVMRLLTDPVARLFSLSRGGYDPAFHEMICTLFHYELFGCVPLSFAYAGFALLLGMGKTRTILIINLARIFIFRLPVIMFFQSISTLGHEAVGMTMAVSNSATGILTLILCELAIRRARSASPEVTGKQRVDSEQLETSDQHKP